MDYQQWRNLQEVDQLQPPAKALKLHQHTPDSALSLFGPEPTTKKTILTAHTLPPFPDLTPTRFPSMGGYFSLAQWQELELQALIYKYMLAGASVPLELILPLKGSVLSSSPYFQHFQSSMLQTGYWGRCGVDPEPGRCRRTDGKKWRCSRDVVVGQKYCDRHVHRGRSRSRKHVEVEIPTLAASSSGSGFKATLLQTPSSAATLPSESQFTLSSPTLHMLPFDQRPPDSQTASASLPQSCCPNFSTEEVRSERPDGRVLRRFFDDWPRSEQKTNANSNDATSAASVTNLSISIPTCSLSDFSLRLSTGNGNGEGSKQETGDGVQPLPLPSAANWSGSGSGSGWGSHGEPSMGGPLAEALRSSTCTPSPTSILQKPSGSISEASSTSV